VTAPLREMKHNSTSWPGEGRGAAIAAIYGFLNSCPRQTQIEFALPPSSQRFGNTARRDNRV